tara:strand:+ start:479 stop:736 length:258 start_codon:yes stop_codon:yes gene_type:complete
MKNELTEEQQIDITMIMATMRAFNEQLYMLKGVHSGVIKQKFNRLINVSGQYEKELLKLTDNSEALEGVYDCLMDVIVDVKKQMS